MIAIVDYGVGNLFSLKSSLGFLGLENVVTSSPDQLDSASHIILPGVGAFGDAIQNLRTTGLDEIVINQAKKGKPLMGICLGMQLLYESSCEHGFHRGLGLLPGKIEALGDASGMDGLKIPHMGWNGISILKDHPIAQGSRQGDFVYFVHSYYAPVSEAAVASASYGGADITALAAMGNVCGAQFHPEKSGEGGLGILMAFSRMK